MDVSNTMRIVILGKTGTGKSSLANTIFGEKLFTVDHTFNSEISESKAVTKSVNGRSITLIDTPGFFDTGRSEEELKPEIVRCITECAPGPHAFLIVLKVEKLTEQEKSVINKIRQCFSEEVLKYSTVVFTHGDQLPEGQTIEDFVRKNNFMSDLVKKCGSRCHVVDNKYWDVNPKHDYRSNQFQVEELLKSIGKALLANKGSCYTNEMLQKAKKNIQQEKEHIRESSGNMSEEEIRKKSKVRVFKKLLIKLAGAATGALLGAFCGVVLSVVVQQAIGEIAACTRAGSAGTSLRALTVAFAAGGLMKGGFKGYDAAEGADTPWEAAKRAAEAFRNIKPNLF